MRLTSTRPPGTTATLPSAAQAAEPRTPAPSFRWPVRVYYEDTDAGGVVYYANYLRFFERCRTEWMRALGFGQHELAERDGVLFVVAAAEVKYLRPALLDDELLVDAHIAERYGSYVIFEQEARRGDQVLCRSRMKVACVDVHSMRPTRLPAALAAVLSGTPGPAAPGAASAGAAAP